MKFRKIKNLFKIAVFAIMSVTFIFSCTEPPSQEEIVEGASSIKGTWKLLTGTIIQGKDTTITDYTANQEFIKIINDTHFAFLRHDFGQDTTAAFVAGGGTYEVEDGKYIEHLDFFIQREWENNKFEFDFEITGDTLTTIGVEKIVSLNVDQLNIEKYIRVK